MYVCMHVFILDGWMDWMDGYLSYIFADDLHYILSIMKFLLRKKKNMAYEKKTSITKKKMAYLQTFIVKSLVSLFTALHNIFHIFWRWFTFKFTFFLSRLSCWAINFCVCIIFFLFLFVCKYFTCFTAIFICLFLYNGWMDGWVDGWMYGWVDGWMGGWMDGWVGGWMDGWMNGWIGGELLIESF